ncbi:MAG: NAD(P)-dependent oxidoreductase [Ktedonobacteraceae bacterium]
MKLAIFGATGRTGKPLVKQALEAGHEVVVLVRTPSKMPLQHDRLTVVQGDSMKAADVEKVVQGTDAVISVLGQSKDSPKDLQTVSTRNIVAAMQKFGVKRLVSLTGAGVDAPQDRPKLFNHLIKFALKAMSGQVLQDGEGHAHVIKDSSLDWVIVRGPMLNEGPFTGKYRIGWVGVNTGARISREDLADFLLKQVTDTTYLHQLPMVSE